MSFAWLYNGRKEERTRQETQNRARQSTVNNLYRFTWAPNVTIPDDKKREMEGRRQEARSIMMTDQLEKARSEKYEVFRIIPESNKCYEYAEYTDEIGQYPKEYYFTNTPPEYVGKHISHHSDTGNGGKGWDIFTLNGKEKRINYSYAGRTSFRPAKCRPLEAAPNSGAGVGGGKRRPKSKRRRHNRRKATRKY